MINDFYSFYLIYYDSMEQFKLMTVDENNKLKEELHNFIHNDTFALMMMANGEVLILNEKLKVKCPQMEDIIGINLYDILEKDE